MTKRLFIDSMSSKWMLVCLSFFLLLPLAIGTGLVVKSTELLETNTLSKLILSSNWSPSEGQYGFYPFILSSVWVTVAALIISMP
jgi:phosphate transport system permease protein